MKKPISGLLSRRVRDLSSFIAMDILEQSQELERAGHDVVNLSIGEPDFPAPLAVKKATAAALLKDRTKYTHSMGMPELREAICRHYWKRYR